LAFYVIVGFSPLVVFLIISHIIAASFSLIYHRLTILTEKLLYGSRYDYWSVVHHVSTSLKSPGFDPLSTAKVICDTTAKSMQLDNAASFLYDSSIVAYEKGWDLQAGCQPIEILELLYEAVRAGSVQISDEYRMRFDGCMSKNGIQVDLPEEIQYMVIQSLVGLNMQLEEMKLQSEVLPNIEWEGCRRR
jgi:hypothetical protein